VRFQRVQPQPVAVRILHDDQPSHNGGDDLRVKDGLRGQVLIPRSQRGPVADGNGDRIEEPVPFRSFRVEPQLKRGAQPRDGQDVGVQRAVAGTAVVGFGDAARPERALVEGQRGIQVAPSPHARSRRSRW